MHGHENHRGGSRLSDKLGGEGGGGGCHSFIRGAPVSNKVWSKNKGGSRGSATESYRMGLLFTHKNGCGGAISFN